jgi:hypothetical protein
MVYNSWGCHLAVIEEGSESKERERVRVSVCVNFVNVFECVFVCVECVLCLFSFFVFLRASGSLSVTLIVLLQSF